MMQHQFWITKKSVQRKFGGKEDDCVVSSDAELDAKLELFRSVSESCVQLQRIIDTYQEHLCYLAQEENALGRYLKECGKNEKNISAGQILVATGKALAYSGHQRLTVRPPLLRLHHEVETFRGRAVQDTRAKVVEMEKVRTEYRAALSWMKSVSSQLDPDTGHGLEQFRKAQSYVKTSKASFDRLMLACLQKVDLLAAARCNMFSHALVPYQHAISAFSLKASETLCVAATKLNNIEPYEFSILSELALSAGSEDKDKSTFFNAEYTDNKCEAANEEKTHLTENESDQLLDINNILGDDLHEPSLKKSKNAQSCEDNGNEYQLAANLSLLEFNWSPNSNLSDCLPSRFIQEGNFSILPPQTSVGIDNLISSKTKEDTVRKNENSKKIDNQVSWLSLFKELDPLANVEETFGSSGDRA